MFDHEHYLREVVADEGSLFDEDALLMIGKDEDKIVNGKVQPGVAL